jgi:hypothetical protein
LSNGPVDYALLYKKFSIVVTEAKKDDIVDGQAQNIAQLVSSREDFLYNLAANKKRTYEQHAPDISSIPSCGVVSTAKEWIFLRYEERPHKAIYHSNVLPLPLIGEVTDAELKIKLQSIVAVLVCMIKLQKQCLDINDVKKQKIEEKETAEIRASATTT